MDEQKYHVYLRQPDRRWYPCVAIKDERGWVAVHVAVWGRPVSLLRARDIEVLKTFRGAERMKVKPAAKGKRMLGGWVPQHPTQFSYMMNRPDVQPMGVNWALRWQRSQAALDALRRQNKPRSVLDPHVASGLSTGHSTGL
jgi:hypothetical protein